MFKEHRQGEKRRFAPRVVSTRRTRGEETSQHYTREETTGTSYDGEWAQAQILEAMVQDMHRLGGLGPGPMLRRGSRLH